jgi:lipoprotein-anchoring transpeptidase ErfK/SrfK
MKTALFLSVLLIGGSYFFSSSSEKKVSYNVKAYKVSKAKRLSSMPIAPVRIVVDKSDYELHVFDAKGWYATYPVVFGNNPLADKKMEGDRCTPEGNFKIAAKRYHNKWSRFLALDYPTSESLAKFAERKRRGEVPPNASPGAGIGIHGTWPREDFVVDRYKNWTNGCISLKRSDVEELYSYISVGTPVTIKK